MICKIKILVKRTHVSYNIIKEIIYYLNMRDLIMLYKMKLLEIYTRFPSFWREKKYPYLIKMLYNIALNKRPIRKQLVEDIGLDAKKRWVALKLTDEEFFKILELGEVDESFIIY